jgi:transposase-like protein
MSTHLRNHPREELLTFYAFPSEQWKSIKTTHPIERLNLECKRRVKTQRSLASEKAPIEETPLLEGLRVGRQES